MPAPSTITGLVKSLDERITNAEAIFASYCQVTPLSKLLRGTSSWAIVGGAVRDVLLSEVDGFEKLRAHVSDIDVALAHRPVRGPFSMQSQTRSPLEIQENSFGGFKTYIAEIGEMDLWVWRSDADEQDYLEFWLEQLSKVDFGLNAVAFVWPQCKIVTHERWRSDLSEWTIEKLCLCSPMRHLQPVRAIALAAKLEMRLGSKTNFGPMITNDIEWILQRADKNQTSLALEYFYGKIKSERWPQVAIWKMAEMCETIDCQKFVQRRILLWAKEFSAGTEQHRKHL